MDNLAWTIILYSSLVFIIFVAIILLIIVFFNRKGMEPQKQNLEKIHKNLKVGRKVVILNAIYGEVSRVDEETIDLKIKTGQIMEVSRYAVTKIL